MKNIKLQLLAPSLPSTLLPPPSSLPLIFRSRQRTGCRARAVRAGRDTRTDGGSAAAHRRAAHWSGCLSSQLSLAGNTRTLSHCHTVTLPVSSTGQQPPQSAQSESADGFCDHLAVAHWRYPARRR